MIEYQALELLAALPTPPGWPQDQRVFNVCPLINALLSGLPFTEEHKAKLVEFPKLIELLEFVAAGGCNIDGKEMTKYHASPGPKATVESFSEAILKGFKDLKAGLHGEVLKHYDEKSLNWRIHID
jgi:hypothetical protein